MADTIGQTLRKAREERSLPVEKIAQALHIRPKYLEALENDRRQDLPSPVQGKGFLRLYADYLNLPVQFLLNQWDGKAEPPAPPVISTLELPTQPDSEPLPSAEPTEKPLQKPVKEAPSPIPAPSSKKQEAPTAVLAPVEAPSAEISPDTSSFEQIGNRLRAQRLALGLSLPEVERYTHVRLHYLQALEDGRIDQLPSPVQGRGMLSNYARFLNLDSEELLLQFATGLQAQRIQRIEKIDPGQTSRRAARKPAQAKPATRRLFSPDLLIGSLLIFIIAGFAIWTAAQVDSLQASQTAATPPSIADVLLNSNPTRPPSLTGTPTEVALLSTLAPGEVNKATPVAQATSSTQAVTVPVSGTLPLQLYILARQRAYLRVTVDGKIAFDGRVEPGKGYTYAGEKKVELLTGSAAALQVFYNQKDLGVLGLVGQVKSMIFTKDGSITPTAQFTVTPTRTIEPSSTMRPSPTVPTVTITPYIP